MVSAEESQGDREEVKMMSLDEVCIVKESANERETLLHRRRRLPRRRHCLLSRVCSVALNFEEICGGT